MLFGQGATGASAQQITERLFGTPRGQAIVSALLGFGLAILFRRTCQGAACVVLRAPPSRELDGKTFRNGDACYRYVARAVPCEGAAAPEGASKTRE